MKTGVIPESEKSDIQSETLNVNSDIAGIPMSDTVNTPTGRGISNTESNNIFSAGVNNIPVDIPGSNTDINDISTSNILSNPSSNTDNLIENINGSGTSMERTPNIENLSAETFASYMGYTNIPDVPTFSNIEFNDGKVTGTETSSVYPGGKQFNMYNTKKYEQPTNHHNYDIVRTADKSKWYRQYSYRSDIEITSQKSSDGSISNHQSMVQKMPEEPKRKGGIKNGK